MKIVVGVEDDERCQHPKIRVELVKATRLAMDGGQPEVLFCPDCNTHIAFATTVHAPQRKKLN